MILAFIVALPFLGAVLPFMVGRAGRTAQMLAALAPTAISLVLLLILAPGVLAGGRVAVQVDWVAQVGLSAALSLDGLGLLFGLLILGIGILVMAYARAYLAPEDDLARLLSGILAFQGAMMGVVLADNLLFLVVFWELTSLASFLLIGFWRRRAQSRRGARLSLIVTGGGGLALLAGVLLLGAAAGTGMIGELAARRDVIQASPLYHPALALILVGAFAKSAQVPFHFWLPSAMVAPTPVSAYLHSATMVKAGVFLLARLWPALSGTEAWVWAVSGAGLATFLLGAAVALTKRDLKAVLAYSTVSHLGLITLMLGLGTVAGAVAAVVHILNHAMFKAALFLGAGVIEHETGTRDMSRLSGVARVMPITAGAMTLAALAMAGVPPLGGFVSKELVLDAVLRGGPGGWLLPVLVTAGTLLSAAYALRLLAPLGGRVAMAPAPSDPGPGLWGAPMLLALLALALGLVPMTLAGGLVATAASAVTGVAQAPDLALWHGMTPALGLSAIALAGGAALAILRPHGFRWDGAEARAVFDRALAALIDGCIALTRALDPAVLRRGLIVLAIGAAGAGLLAFLTGTQSPGTRTLIPAGMMLQVTWVLLVAAVLATLLLQRDRFVALLMSGISGLVVSVWFFAFSAPDLALTQIGVEVVSVILLLLTLARLPAPVLVSVPGPARASSLGSGRKQGLGQGLWQGAGAGWSAAAVAAGLGVGALAYALMTRDTVPTAFASLADYFLAQSVPGGGGANVVNVILVDFRGFDTFGEITVLAIAGLAVHAIAGPIGAPLSRRRPPAATFAVTAQALAPLGLLVAAYLFLRGHNAPGGGFVAGLVTAIALLIPVLAGEGPHPRVRLLPMIAMGLLTAGGTGLAAWVFANPFLTSAHGHIGVPLVGAVEIASAMAFDLGVFLTVLGATRLTLSTLAHVREG